jgi:hypothetical protein
MISEAEAVEYLEEIRQQVCSRCVERPPGGPPCAPLGKPCGVEMHLPQLIEAIHAVHSDLIEPYLEHNRQTICSRCAYLHSSICPCPMDYLLVLLVQAVETVDERRQRREQIYHLLSVPPAEVSLEAVRQAYREATGTWVGCDWPTQFGKSGLDLKGWRAAAAAQMAQQVSDPVARADWQAAAQWLARVETYAQQAEAQAARALDAAEKGNWPEAFAHAYQAWSLEFATGRPIWRGFPLTWQRLCQTLEALLRRYSSPSNN